MKRLKFLRVASKGSVVCGVLGVVFALAISPAHADQMNDLCTILNTTRNNQAALKRQIENERNPLKQDSLKQQLHKSIEQGDASVKSFLEVNNRQFTNFTGVVSGLHFQSIFFQTMVTLSIRLPCAFDVSFSFIDRGQGFFIPEEEASFSKWRTALENFVKGDSVTFSGRFTRRDSLARAVMTELRKKGGIAYKVPDEYIVRENAGREDELRQEKIIQDIASQLSGKWVGGWKLSGIVNPLATNEGTFSLDLIRDGSALTGTYYENGGSSAVSGNIDGKQITFGYQYTDGTNRTFTGTINATGEVSGQWRQKNGSGTWRIVKTSSINTESTPETPVNIESMLGTPDSQGIYTHSADPHATPLYYRNVDGIAFNPDMWQWSADQKHWMSLNQEKVIGGRYNGQSPSKLNVKFIRSLEAAISRRAREIAEREKQDNLDRQLYQLVFSGSATLSAVQQLVANGASPGRTLSVAIEADRTDIAEFLIGKGADVNGGIDDEGGPFIFRASSVKMVELLLAKGANLNLSSPFGWGGNWLIAAIRQTGSPTMEGRSLAVIEFLLARGVSVTAKDVQGNTPLALARSERENTARGIAEQRAKGITEPDKLSEDALQRFEKELRDRDAVIALLLKYGAKD